jgi:hypothetical protein
MPRNDPTNTGGLFVGRRPGTAPLRYRGEPERKDGRRRLVDRMLAGGILALETLLCATIWGPQPAAWLWVGSHVDYLTDNVVLGLLTAFAGMVATIMVTIGLAMRLDRAWKLVRRAAGHEQKEGVLERIFIFSLVVGGAAFAIWLFVIQGPGSEFSPSQ